MVAEIFGGISALKASLDILKTIKDANDVTTRQAIVIKLHEQILAAQEAQFSLIEQVSALKAEVASFEKWDAEKQQYELKNLGWSAFAYMLKPDARGSKPAHWICTRCYGDRDAQVIQQSGNGLGYTCPRCHNAIKPSEIAFETGTGRPKWLD